MRFLLWWCLLCLLPLHAVRGDYLEAYSLAQASEEWVSSPEAVALWERARLAAEAAGNAEIAFVCGYRKASRQLNLERIAEALATVEESLARFERARAAGERWTRERHALTTRVYVLNLHERCLARAGRLSEGWAALRGATGALREIAVRGGDPDPDLDLLALTSLAGWRPEERALAWRAIEREADYLDRTGRTLAAFALLDRATLAVAAKGEDAFSPQEWFFIDKLILNRTLLLDFLGWHERALAEQQALSERLERRGRDRSYWVARINCLRNLSQWEGPSEATLAAAREAAEHLRAPGGGRTGADQLVVRMERDLWPTKATRDQLRADVARLRAAGMEMDAQVAERDLLVAEAEDENLPGLDPQFVALLERLRRHGNKRGEPTLYREYAHYLARQQRPAEAIPLYREAIRLTRAFGWVLHLPPLYTALATVHLEAGDLVGAAAVWAELDRLLAATPELPPVRRMYAEVARAHYLARLGRLDQARAALARATTWAEQGRLPSFQRKILAEPKLEDSFSAGVLALASATSLPAATTADLQPLAIRSDGPSALPLRSRFTLTNPTASPLAGTLRIGGPGLVWPAVAGEESFSLQVTGGDYVAVDRAVRLDAGTQLLLGLVAAAEVTGEVTLLWDGPDGEQTVRWQVERSGTRQETAVLNAVALQRNPFHVQSLTHQIARDGPATVEVPFRLRSPVPIRLEYYLNDELIGIDAEGDGDFTGPGDLLPPPPTTLAAAPAAPRVRFEPARLETEVEIFLFGANRAEDAAGELTLEAEAFADGGWETFARDVLRPPPR